MSRSPPTPLTPEVPATPQYLSMAYVSLSTYVEDITEEAILTGSKL